MNHLFFPAWNALRALLAIGLALAVTEQSPAAPMDSPDNGNRQQSAEPAQTSVPQPTEAALSRKEGSELAIGLDGHQASHAAIVERLRAAVEYQSVKPTNEAAYLSLAELHAGQLQWREELNSISMDFVCRSERLIDTPSDVEKAREGKGMPRHFSIEFQLAIKGDKRYTRYRETVARSERLSTPTYIYGYNGEQVRTFEPDRALGQIHPAQIPGLESQGVWYYDAISIPVGPNGQRLRESSWYIPTALRNERGEYKVLPTLELVDGHLCHVVTSGWDTMWLDPEHGFALRRRVRFRRTGPDDPGCLRYVFVCADLVQADDSIWLPTRCWRLDYGTQSEPEALRGRLLQVNEVTASHERLLVNNVPDELFEVEFPPGTEVQDLVAQKVYIVPEGEELLEAALADAVPIVNGIVTPHDRSSAVESSRSWGVLIVNGVLLTAVILLALVYRAKLRQETPKE